MVQRWSRTYYSTITKRNEGTIPRPRTSSDCIKKFDLSSYVLNFRIAGILTTRQVAFYFSPSRVLPLTSPTLSSSSSSSSLRSVKLRRSKNVCERTASTTSRRIFKQRRKKKRSVREQRQFFASEVAREGGGGQVWKVPRGKRAFSLVEMRTSLILRLKCKTFPLRVVSTVVFQGLQTALSLTLSLSLACFPSVDMFVGRSVLHLTGPFIRQRFVN